MRESFTEAREELKRADHLLYVSLKYTRTVDVIKSLIDRLINCIERLIDTLLKYDLAKKKIKEIPPNAGLKANLCQEMHTDPIVREMIEFYGRLRKIKRAEFKRSNEYRRHVTMTAILEDGIVNIDIDTIKEYYEHTIYYFHYMGFVIGLGEKPEDYVPWNQEKKED